MSYLGFSSKWASYLAKTHHLDEEKQLEITYAIEIITLNGLNVFLTLTLAWVLGVFGGTLVCLLTSAAFRHNAGGGHSESPWLCAMATIIIFPLLALMASNICIWPTPYLNILSLLSVFIGFIIIFLYAPVDNIKAPITSRARRIRLRKLAFWVMLTISLIILGLSFSGWQQAAYFRLCIVFSLLWFSFNLTPWGQRLWHFIDNIGLTI
ncbi:MAG: accessory gene regulator ArgB-like protein [Syntrophomonadaceae bacterium]